MPPLFSKILSEEKSYRPIAILSMGGILFAIGNSVLWFVFPILAEKLSSDLMVVGLLVAIPSAIAMFCDIPMGGLSDHMGRKKLFIGALIAMILLGVILPSANTLPKFAIFMVLFGFANLCILVPTRAYIMDIAPKAKTSEYFGIFEVAYQIGFTLGPVIAGYLIADQLEIGIANTAVFYPLTCLAAALILLLVKETVIKGKSTFVSIKDTIIKDKLFSKSLLDYKDLHFAGMAILLSTFIMTFIDGIVWTYGPLYTTLGVDAETVGLMLSMFVLPFILFEVPAGLIADRFGKIKVFIGGLSFAGVSFLLFSSSKDSTMLLASAFLATTGLAFARPAILGFLTDISAKKERGGIAGVWNVAEDFAYVASPILGGVISEIFGIDITFMLVGVMLLISIPIIYLAIKRSKH